MYYVLGPVIAVLISMKYTKYMASKQEERCRECCDKIELVSTRLTDTETEMPKRVMATMLPVAKAVQKLNREVGL